MFAQMLASTCNFAHSKCNPSTKLIAPGQNLAILWSTGSLSFDMAFKSAQNGWWDEQDDINRIDKRFTYKSIQTDRRGDQYGHFTTMSGNRGNRMGCALVKFFDGRKRMNAMMTVCNYSGNNMYSQPVYDVGKLRSKCKTNSTTYPGLCGKGEDYSRYIYYKKNNRNVPPVNQWKKNGHMLDFLR